MTAELLWGALLIGSAGAPQAQDRPTEPVAPDEIIVTGERVPRSLFDTPSSVVVMTADMIDALAAPDRIEQLLAFVPNLQQGSGSDGPTIRGQDSTGVLRDLSAFLGGTRPRVTLQVDGRALNYYEFVFGMASVWDVEQVEVFRSPQTTTQGRNSIGGAIFVRTNDPTYAWEGGARAIVADDATWQGSAAVSGPLIEDQLAFRASGDVRLSRPSSDMADGIPGADIDIEDFGVARLKLLAEPTVLPGTRLETSYVHAESQAPQFNAVAAPFRERRFPLPDRTNGVYRNRVDSLTARLDYRLAPALTSRTTLSYGDALVQRFGLPGLGRTRIDAEDFSLEATLDWQPEGPFRAIGGVHRLEARLKQFIDITGLGIGAGTFGDRQTSFGLFGEATLRPAAPVTITAGLRYQRDSQDREGQVGPPASGVALDYDRTFDAWLPKLSLAYELTEDLTAGALIQRAFNPGGTTINFMTRAQDSFEAETLWSYEAFARSSFAGGRGLVAANLFHNDMSDAQRPQTVRLTLPDGRPFFTVDITNAPSAESYGAELELGWRATDRLRVRVGVGLLRTEVRRTIPPAHPIEGKEFQRSPNFTAAAAIDWTPLDALRLSAQLRHSDGYFSDDANSPALRIGGATVLDARAAYTSGRFTAFGYVRNALDDFHLRFLFNPTFGVAGDPREFGAGLEARF